MLEYLTKIEALSSDYVNIYIVEPERDVGTVVKLDGFRVTGGAVNEEFRYSEMLEEYAEQRVYVEDRVEFLDLLLPTSLIHSFSQDRSKLEFNYRVKRKDGIHYFSAHFSRMSNKEEPLKLICGLRNVDNVISMEWDKLHEGLFSAYNTVSGMFLSMHRINLKTNTFISIKTTASIQKGLLPDNNRYDENLKNVLTHFSSNTNLGDLLEFADRESLRDRLKRQAHVSTEFMSSVSGLCRLHFQCEDYDENGDPLHVILAVEIEDADKSSAVFNTLARNLQNVFWINLIDGSSRLLKMAGKTRRELNAKLHRTVPFEEVLVPYMRDRVHPEDRDAFYHDICLNHLREVFHSKQEHTGNYRILINGEVHHYQYTFLKIQDLDYIVAAFQNVDDMVELRREEEERERTRQLEEQKRLEQQVAIFDALARNYKNAYLVNLDAGTAKVLKLDDEFNDGRLDGFDGSEFEYEPLLNAWISEAVHPEDRDMLCEALSVSHLREVFKTQAEYTGYYRMLVNGRVIHYQFSQIKLKTGGSIIAGFQNVDDIIRDHMKEEEARREKEKAYQEQLLAAVTEAKNANKSKTDFLLRMSHDIRTPLNGIIGMLDVAEHYADDLTWQTECRKRIRESSSILLELINEVLDMSKLESGEVVLEHIPFDLGALARECFIVVEQQAKDRDIKILEVDCRHEHPHLLGSPIHYKRLVMSILGNAIKYNKDHGKVYITSREASFDGHTAVVEFICRDTGIGMSREFQEHLFEPFAQENFSSRTHYSGTGLGMPITKSLVEKMGGTISFESEPGVGTAFTVRIPFEVDFAPAAPEAAPEEEENVSVFGLTILLAEDNELNMEIATFLLEEEGARILPAHNGQEAVEAFAASKPGEIDVVLMDIMMPVMDGYEATRRIRAMEREDAGRIPIVAMTANAFAEDKIASRNAGMNEHIAKPLDTNTVLRVVSHLAREYRGE